MVEERERTWVSIKIAALPVTNNQLMLGAGRRSAHEEGATFTVPARSRLTCEALLKTSLSADTVFSQ